MRVPRVCRMLSRPVFETNKYDMFFLKLLRFFTGTHAIYIDGDTTGWMFDEDHPHPLVLGIKLAV